MINKKFINKIKNKRILFSYSGGLDSTVLLHKILQIKYKKKNKLRVIHINHKININSKYWSLHCKNQCKLWKLPIIIKKIKFKIKNSNIEEKARKERYKIIKKYIKKKEILITAHNLNDNCESFLLSIKRGSGLKGLSSMSFKNKIYSFFIFRPFINKNRNYILKWAIFYKLNWIEDESNKNIRYDRNFLRCKIIPKLKKRWPFILKTINRSCKICFTQNKILKVLTKNLFNKFILLNNSININKLLILNKYKFNILFRYWLEKNDIKNLPSKKKLIILYKEFLKSKHNSNSILKFDKYKIYRKKKFIFIKIN